MSELVNITENVWAVEAPIQMPGGVRMKTRMTVVRLGDGRIWVHSPIAMQDELASKLSALGPVSFLVAPNRYHHLRMGEASKRFSQARVFGAPGLREKIRGLRVDEDLSNAAPSSWANELEQVVIDGAPEMSEVVFLHKPSGTLVISDLLFNILEPEGFSTKMILTLMGTRGRLAKSRFWWRLTKDRAAFDASVKKMLGWDFDRLIMAHGEVVPAGAKEKTATILGV